MSNQRRRPADRRDIIHNAIRAGERAALRGQPETVPDIYAGDSGQSGAWLIGYRNQKAGRGRST